MATAPLQQLAVPVPAGIVFSTPTALGATRFLAFGDSITVGAPSSYDGRELYDALPGAYPERLQIGLNYYHAPQRFIVINRGVGAEAVSIGGLSRIKSILDSDRPQALLLLEGINDLAGGISPAHTVGALQSVIDISLQRNIPVLVATMFQTYPTVRPPTGTDPETPRSNAAEDVPEFNRLIRQMAAAKIAARQNVTLVDIEAAFGSNRALVGNDGLHPTPEGYDRMASEFLRAIQRAFPVRGSFQ
jgi:lysophospholipase L1-like esterase